MRQGTRIALLVAATLVVAVSGTVLATRQAPADRQPERVTQDGDEAPPTAEDLAHAAARLTEAEIAFDEAVLADLAARYGIGGAVRVLAWANDPEDQITVESITRLRDTGGPEGTGMGWGRIAKDIGVHPGIGRIMGGGGGNAGGQQDEAP